MAVAIIKRPHCGYEGEPPGFRLLRKPWGLRFYEVKMLECLHCHGVFNHYYGISPRGGVSEFTVRVRPRPGGAKKS